MHEQTLCGFFCGEVTAQELARDLAGSLGPNGYCIVDMKTDYTVLPQDLVRVCDAVLAGAVRLQDIEIVGFCLIASDQFTWDSKTPAGKLIAQVLHEWVATEANSPFTIENVKKFRTRLVKQKNE